MENALKFIREYLDHSTLPLWLKALFTLFVLIMIPTYWALYGPLSFLWFCNLAVLIALFALWLESSLLASMQVMPIIYPHLIWQIDAVLRITIDRPILGAADYMFDPELSPVFKFVSMNHAFLLYLLIWMIWRLGYDRRAFLVQTFFASVVVFFSYLLTTDMHGPVGNLNKVYGLSDGGPQTFMLPWLWVALVIVYEMLNNAGVHVLLRMLFRPTTAAATPSRPG